MIRELHSRDIEGVLKLNNESVPAVNKLLTGDLENILSMSKKSWGIEIGENIVAALITLESGEPYQSDNYIWLETQFNNFCYVDRIMVDVAAKRNGYGKKLYATLESYAKEMGIEVLLCEVNVEPPNPHSLAFHTDLGWKPFYEREHGPGKKVRYFKKPISAG